MSRLAEPIRAKVSSTVMVLAWSRPASHTRDHHDAPPIADEGIEHEAHGADEERPDDRRPEAVDLEALDDLGGEPLLLAVGEAALEFLQRVAG